MLLAVKFAERVCVKMRRSCVVFLAACAWGAWTSDFVMSPRHLRSVFRSGSTYAPENLLEHGRSSTDPRRLVPSNIPPVVRVAVMVPNGSSDQLVFLVDTL